METVISCNLCSSEILDGLCYRTRCRHFYCEACACKSFSGGTSCPICKCRLTEEEIYQITVGISPIIEEEFLYQKVLQNPNWDQVLLNTNNSLHSFVDLLQFIQYQLYFEAKKFKSTAGILQKNNEELQRDLNRQSLQIRTQTSHAEAKIRDLEHKLNVRERELSELKDAYKEKLRKCNAWEKAYSNLRDQIESRSNPNSSKQLLTHLNSDKFDHNPPQDITSYPSSPEKHCYSEIDNVAADGSSHYDRNRRSYNDLIPKLTRRTEVTTFRSFHQPYERHDPPEDTTITNDPLQYDTTNSNFRQNLESIQTKTKPSFVKSNPFKIQNKKSLF